MITIIIMIMITTMAITPTHAQLTDEALSTLRQIRLPGGDDTSSSSINAGPASVRRIITPSENVRAAATPDSVTVGDPISMTVMAIVPKGTQLIPPETGNGFGDFTVLSWNSQTRAGKDADTALFNYRLAVFKPENCTIPPLPYLSGDGRRRTEDGLKPTSTDEDADTAVMDTLWSPSIPILVASVIPPDTPVEVLTVRDLKAQQRTGRAGFRSLWLLLAAAVAIIIYYIMERRVKKGSAETGVPRKPPYDEAMELLDALEKKGLIERGEAREYVFELSEIFKRYIGRRYNTIAPELTTEEIIGWLEFSELSRDMRLCAERFFRESDHVKYAKRVPGPQILNGFMKEVRTFLEATKPNPELQYEVKTQKLEAAQ